MIACGIRVRRGGSEWIRDRFERTGIGNRLLIAQQIRSETNQFLLQPFAVLLLRALIDEFARVLQAIIHAAVNLERSPTPQITTFPFFRMTLPSSSMVASYISKS